MPFSPSDAWLQGLGAAFVQLAAGEFAAAVRGTHTSPVRALGKWLVDTLPTPLIDVAIALLRRGDKPAIAIALTLFSLGVPAMAATAGTATLVAALLLSGLLGLYALWRRTELSRTTAAPWVWSRQRQGYWVSSSARKLPSPSASPRRDWRW